LCLDVLCGIHVFVMHGESNSGHVPFRDFYLFQVGYDCLRGGEAEVSGRSFHAGQVAHHGLVCYEPNRIGGDDFAVGVHDFCDVQHQMGVNSSDAHHHLDCSYNRLIRLHQQSLVCSVAMNFSHVRF